MTLIKSISGIRGTIGGKPGDALTPVDVVKFASAFAVLVRRRHKGPCKVVVGRDARMSGKMVSSLVCSALSGMGINVIDVGLSTTPTVEMAVTALGAQGGVILTASHNPREWNALKLLNERGEFIDEADGQALLAIVAADAYEFADVDHLGSYTKNHDMLQAHIQKILALPYVDMDLISKRNFRVVIDAINSSGAIAVPELLRALGVKDIDVINSETTGNFAHNPEPLPEHLKELSDTVKSGKADMGISIDPDVDRLAFVCENGEMFGEEYTLVAVADHVLRRNKGGNTVSNLSSTRALQDVTEAAGGRYSASAVGEVNVVRMMKETNAVIGGEGNGGVILPELHYGRDALVGIAIFLSLLATENKSMTALKATYPAYHISKNKVTLTPGLDVDAVLAGVRKRYPAQPANTADGVRLEFGRQWVHLRKSNTEPIIRIYSEAASSVEADQLAARIMNDIRELSQSA